MSAAPNTIPEPSGSHDGSKAPSGRSVSFCASPPSSGMRKSWGLPPSALRVNARRLPSGENAGSLLENSGEVSARGSPPLPLVGASQMRPLPAFFSRSYVVTVTASRVPSGEGTGVPTRGMDQMSWAVIGRSPLRAG